MLISVICPKCQKQNAMSFTQLSGGKGLQIQGMVKCLNDCHEWPITIINNSIAAVAQQLPDASSQNLGKVPEYIRQDIEEAERALYAQCCKASVVMCRRGLQLAIETFPCAPERQTLGPLLKWARAQKPALLSPRADTLAEGIKDYGDAAAHRVEIIDHQTAAMVIYVTVMALNELAPKMPLSASQSGTDSSEQ